MQLPLTAFYPLSTNATSTHGRGVVREVISNQADLKWNNTSGQRNTAGTIGGQLIFTSSSPSSLIPPSTAQRRSAYVLGALTSLSILFCHRLPRNMLELNWLLHMNEGSLGCLTRQALMEFSPELLEALDHFQLGNNSLILPIIESYCYSGTISAVSPDALNIYPFCPWLTTIPTNGF